MASAGSDRMSALSTRKPGAVPVLEITAIVAVAGIPGPSG